MGSAGSHGPGRLQRRRLPPMSPPETEPSSRGGYSRWSEPPGHQSAEVTVAGSASGGGVDSDGNDGGGGGDDRSVTESAPGLGRVGVGLGPRVGEVAGSAEGLGSERGRRVVFGRPVFEADPTPAPGTAAASGADSAISAGLREENQ